MRFSLVLLLFAAEVSGLGIGTLVDGPLNRFEQIRVIANEEIIDLMGDEFEVVFPESGTLTADWTQEGVRDHLDRLLADPEVDVIIAMGVLSSNEAARRSFLPKPVIAPFIVDPSLQGANGTVDNLNYVGYPFDMERDLATFRALVPFRHLAVLVDSELYASVPGFGDFLRAKAKKAGSDITVIPLNDRMIELPRDVDAVYLTPLVRFSEDQFVKLVNQMQARKLPSFSLMGRDEVEGGVLAAIAPSTDMPRLMRRISLNLQAIALGEKPCDLPSHLDQSGSLSFNMATADMIGLSPTWQVLTEAELVHNSIDPTLPEISLCQAISEAMDANLDLIAADLAVAVTRGEVGQARSQLLPHIELSGIARMIQADTARAAVGQKPERLVAGAVSIRQVLYSDQVWAQYEISRWLSLAKREERDEVRLDVVLAISSAYVELLRAKTLLRIQEDNLAITRHNLQFAKQREKIGVARSNEVYRWESQIARNRKEVVSAKSQVRLAEILINRLLRHSQLCHFRTQELNLNQLLISTDEESILDYISTPRSFGLFQQFAACEGMRNAPELRELDAKIAAANRAVVSAQRAFYLPDVGLFGTFVERALKGGSGSTPPPIIGGNNDYTWAVGVEASFPLYKGGGKRADRRRAAAEAARMKTVRWKASTVITERIYSALEQAQASFISIDLAHASAEAARKNFDLVADAYARGTISIIDLLDAQNASLVAEELEADALYDFVLDMLRVMRAMGKFDFFMSPRDKQAWFCRLNHFFSENCPCATL